MGNGEDDDNRSNAYTLDWNGNGWFAGSIKVGGTNQEDKAATEVALKSDFEEVLNRATPVAEANSDYGTVMARGIYAGTTDMEDGVTPLTSGVIYLVYK